MISECKSECLEIQVKYLENNSQDGYQYKKFFNFEDLGEWIYENIKDISILEINKEIMNWC